MDNPDRAQALIQFFKAIGQEDRLKIMGLLAGAPRSVADLAAILNQKESLVARHLRRLQEAGLVTEEAPPFTAVYRLDEAGLAHFQARIEVA